MNKGSTASFSSSMDDFGARAGEIKHLWSIQEVLEGFEPIIFQLVCGCLTTKSLGFVNHVLYIRSENYRCLMTMLNSNDHRNNWNGGFLRKMLKSNDHSNNRRRIRLQIKF